MKTTKNIALFMFIWVVMFLDRIIRSPLIGVKLPSIRFDEGIPKATDETPEGLKQELREETEIARKEFIKYYLSPATKRLAALITILVAVWVFTNLSWTNVLYVSSGLTIAATSIYIAIKINRKRLVNKYLNDED